MPDQLKVVHISTSYKGGAGRSAYRIHEALLKSGVNSSFLCLDESVPPALQQVFIAKLRLLTKPTFVRRQINRIRFRLKKHFKIELTFKNTIINDFQALKPAFNCEIATLPFSDYEILENPIVKNADIIHLHWVAGMLDYPSFFLDNIKPVVWTLHDMSSFQGLFHYQEDELRNKGIAGRLDGLTKSRKKRASRSRRCRLEIIAPSNWMLNEAKNSICFKNVSSHCIAYALDTALFSRELVTDFRRRYSIPEQNIVFLFVAQSVNNYRKGFDLLLAALNDLKDLPITLLILGEAKDLEIEGLDVRKLGTIDNDWELRNVYSSADAFVLPSREDNLPNVMLEALACGTPVIGFRVGGIKEHIVEDENGLLAEELNSKSLSSAMRRLYSNRELFNPKKIAAYANNCLNEKLICKKYAEIYEGILK